MITGDDHPVTRCPFFEGHKPLASESEHCNDEWWFTVGLPSATQLDRGGLGLFVRNPVQPARIAVEDSSMSDAVTIHRIETFRAGDAAGAIAGIWRDATKVSDTDAQSFASGTYPKHVSWPGFRLFMAAVDGHPVGFIYGYNSLPGQWWHDQVLDALVAAGHESWVENALELAEIAVLPQFQGRGIGTRLIDAYLVDVAQPVLLALEAADDITHTLYAAHGFRDLLTDFAYSGWDDRIIVMGRPA
jgi:GNAT superfamily N-acetyltransferase